MPGMANITVKKADETNTVTFSVVTPSGGDSSPAIWKNAEHSYVPAQRPQLTVKSEWNGPKTARRLIAEFRYPTLKTGTDGQVIIADIGTLNATILVPQGMHEEEAAEFVHQGLNLLASTLFKDACKSGYSPV